MSCSTWDDFNDCPDREDKRKQRRTDNVDEEAKQENKTQDTVCDWGQSEGLSLSAAGQCGKDDTTHTDTSKFIKIYEKYLEDKKSILQRTKNYKVYSKNPQKQLRDWFENEGHEFKIDSEKSAEKQHICSVDLPIEEHDFTVTSEVHSSKKEAIEEVCLDACRMLDDCQLLLYTPSSINHRGAVDNNDDDDDEVSVDDLERTKRRIGEANKEDDIVFDRTLAGDDDELASKRHRGDDDDDDDNQTSTLRKPKVHTYESLMAKWSELNMSILKQKAKLVKLDLSVAKGKSCGGGNMDAERATKHSQGTTSNTKQQQQQHEDDDEIDPLDEFMSNLEKKTELSMDEKIEKSRIKSQIVSYEREQSQLVRLIELARPAKTTTTTPSNKR